jgi:hypothetical protein
MSRTPLLCPRIAVSDLAGWMARPSATEPVLTLRQAWNPASSLLGGTVRFAWNGASLLLHATLPDRDIFNPVTRYNEPAYLAGDVFEIFLRPYNQPAYYELHISPTNQRYQARFPKNRADARPGETIEPTTVDLLLLSEVYIDHANARWEVFAEIPLSPLCESAPLSTSSEWLVSFSRYDYTRTDNGMTAELFSTSPHAELSFHRQHEWSSFHLGT